MRRNAGRALADFEAVDGRPRLNPQPRFGVNVDGGLLRETATVLVYEPL